MKKEITMMVAAFNEEKDLQNAVTGLDKILRELFDGYEIIIFDDGSTDNTPQIADSLAKNNSKIRVVHNDGNKGLGYNYRKAAGLARKKYFGWIPGDDETDRDSLREVLSHVGESDIIISYTTNKKIRSFFRRILSGSYTFLLNALFNLRLRYYNGISIYRTDDLRKVRMTTNSFAFPSEILVTLLKKGISYMEIPMKIRPKKETKIFRIKNVIGVVSTIASLFFRHIFGRL